MRILIGCESSGVVREAFRRLGHDAWSCDLLPADDGSPFHIQGDILVAILQGWDLGIFHPPCTYLSASGLHWNGRHPDRPDDSKTEAALEFVRQIMRANIPRMAIENPKGIISTRIRKPEQIIQPFEFGDDASKETCLWLKNLPPLTPTKRIAGRRVGGELRTANCELGFTIEERWSNQTDSGQNKLTPSETRWKDRSKTYPGLAAAMASQWGALSGDPEPMLL